MQVWGAAQNPRRNVRLAIFYGKQAVNTCQAIRGSLQALDPKARRSFLATFSYVYRNLADLLIGQGRLPEAQQVLRMLKEQEFYDFLNPGQDHAATPAPLDTIAPTPHEKMWEGRYEDAAASVTAHARVTAVETQMAADFQRPPTAEDALPDTAQAAQLAAALTPGTVAVYTIVAPDRLDLIVVTPAHDGRPAAQVFRSVPITADALYQQVRAFRWALADPAADPRPLAAELYQAVFGPIQNDLDAARADTVLFSLDDALRYLPLAALYDDKTHQYVVQRYATAEITLAAQTSPATTPATVAPSVLGAGVSLSLDGLPALPGVREELDDIIRSDAHPSGLLPGTRLLDPDFTRPALLEGLGAGRFPYVHLASHFALHPTDANSYLLLGDGTRLSVADMAADPQRFRGVSLLALSACDTDMEVEKLDGAGGGGPGGAGAAPGGAVGAGVIVAGVGRGDAGADGLVLRADEVAPGLAAAARLAAGTTLDAGRVSRPHGPAVRRGRAARDGDGRPAGRRVPAAVRGGPQGALRTPDYWAPFVLLGNWK